LNPSVFPSVNSSEKNPRHPAVAIFKKKNSRRRRCRRYIPTAFFCRVIPTDFETELFPSAMFTDGNNSVGNSVGVIRFSGSDRLSTIESALFTNTQNNVDGTVYFFYNSFWSSKFYFG
jgi:hypothetical protein